MTGDITPWHRFTPVEVQEIVFHGWLCRAQLDEAEARHRAGDKFALLALPGYARPDDAACEKFKNYFFKENNK